MRVIMTLAMLTLLAACGGSGNSAPGSDLLESLNIESAIHAARAARDSLEDPAGMELHLRRWHAVQPPVGV